MKCIICKKELTGRQKKYCSPFYNSRSQYIKNRDVKIRRAKEYYHKNRDDVLKKQIERCNLRYRNDSCFKERRDFRKTVQKYISLDDKKCSVCGVTEDLHRHHPDYNDSKSCIILCRTCHNKLHFRKTLFLRSK